MDQVISATFWGFVSGGALVVGALIGYYVNVSSRLVAGVMAFGSGVLISALSFELMLEAFNQAGMTAAASGFLFGAFVYALANRMLASRGAKHRKRSGAQQPSEDEQSGSGTAIALGALLDGVPESIAIGLSLLRGGAVSVAVVFAATTAVAAGAMLTMIVDTMIPEAFAQALTGRVSACHLIAAARACRQYFAPGGAVVTRPLPQSGSRFLH